MKCPKCHKEVEMLKYTRTGTMCRECDCDSTAVIDSAFCSSPHLPDALDKILAALALSLIPDPKGSPREAFESCQPYFEECIVTPENGGCVRPVVFTQELGGQTVPKVRMRYIRQMSKTELQNLTQEKINVLMAVAYSMPSVDFHLQ